jgi:GTP-binding protein HflX
MQPRPAVLICYKDSESLEEALGLCEAAGYQAVGIIRMRGLKHGKFGVGAGKADEAKDTVRESKASHLIVDDKLSVAESYNLSKHCNCEVVDREKLILEIFKNRATSQEAVLQVKAAELTYELPRVRDNVRFVRMGEQPGMFGYGSYEVEKYYRNIKARLDGTRRKLAVLKKRRELFRAQRLKNRLSIVSLAGYTAAGKTTLFNRLVNEHQPVLGRLFSTLSTTTRRLEVDGIPVLLSDTVGFISRLPHYMIEAFKSTLEELSYADLVLLIVDVSDPPEKLRLKFDTSKETLSELNVSADKTVVVFNKVDVLSEEEAKRRAKAAGADVETSAFISAKTGQGIENLLKTIKHGVLEAAELEAVLTPEKAANLYEKTKYYGGVVSVKERIVEDGRVHLLVKGPEWVIRELRSSEDED